MEDLQVSTVAELLRTRLLRFVRDHLTEVNHPTSYAHGEDGDFKLKDKILIETSLLLYIIKRSFPADQALALSLKECAQEVACLTAEPRIIALIHKNPQYSLVLGLSFICLKKLGVGNKEYEDLLGRIIRLNKTHTSEKIPFREFDIKWVRYCFNKKDAIVISNHSSSILSLTTSPIYMSKADAYAVTHALMYLTDFGTSTRLLKEYDKTTIYHLLRYCLVWCISVEDFDLTAELLMAYYFCNFYATPLTQLCASRLEAVFHTTGYLPGPSFDQAAHAQLPNRARAAYVFEHAYHTTYVFGMYLCAATRHTQRRQHVRVDTTASLRQKRLRNRPVVEAAVGKIKKFLKNRFGVDSVAQFPFDAYFFNEEPQSYLASILAAANPSSLFTQVLAHSHLSTNAQCLVLLDALVVTLSKDYSLEVLVDVLCVGLTNFLEKEHDFLIQEAIEFLLLQQTTQGAVGTFFYQQANLQVKEKETVLFHAKLIYLFEKYLAYS